MTAQFLAASTADFVPSDEPIQSLWRFACEQQMAAEGGLWDGAWRSAANAWAELARACPPQNRADASVWWTLAGDAARKARRARR